MEKNLPHLRLWPKGLAPPFPLLSAHSAWPSARATGPAAGPLFSHYHPRPTRQRHQLLSFFYLETCLSRTQANAARSRFFGISFSARQSSPYKAIGSLHAFVFPSSCLHLSPSPLSTVSRISPRCFNSRRRGFRSGMPNSRPQPRADLRNVVPKLQSPFPCFLPASSEFQSPPKWNRSFIAAVLAVGPSASFPRP